MGHTGLWRLDACFSISLSVGTFGYSDNLASLGTPVFSTAPANPGVGTHAITVSGLSSANYAIAYDNTGILTVTPRPITVKADAVTRVYGDSTPASPWVTMGSFGYTDNVVLLAVLPSVPIRIQCGPHPITVSRLAMATHLPTITLAS